MARFIVALAVLLSLIALACKDEVVISGQEELVDPHIQPKLTYSSPALNSVGPFFGWGEYPSTSYIVYLRFNKLMEPASVYGGLVLRS